MRKKTIQKGNGLQAAPKGITMDETPADLGQLIFKKKTGNVKNILTEYQVTSVTGLQTGDEKQTVTLFKREKHSTAFWNPLHFAIYKKDS